MFIGVWGLGFRGCVMYPAEMPAAQVRKSWLRAQKLRGADIRVASKKLR